ncbi:MAG TPA: hypothetical protein VLC91_09955, partial [Spongiibacteraceae bacterium]|nr:hypothetical protein [Spongiibacteraceae bacterium]
IAFAATVANNIVASAAPAGQIAGIVNSSRSVAVTFATDDGHPASGLVVTSDLAALPAGWSSNGGATFGCASVVAGNACQLSLAYAPSAIGGGTLALDYSYLDNSGVAKTGTLNIPYTATTDNNIVAIPLTATQLDVRVGEAAVVMLRFATDDGNAVHAFTITSALPSGWSVPTGLTCGGVITAGCNTSFTYAPTNAVSGTFTVTYSYADNSGVAKTGSFDIGYRAKTVYAYVASFFGGLGYCPLGVDGSLGSCIATANTVSGPSGIVFHGDKAYVSDNAAVYVCNIDSDGSIASCAATGSAFQIPFMLASTATHLYAVNSTITRCDFTPNGSLTNCIQLPPTGLAFPAGMAIANGTAYVSDGFSGTVATCAVDAMTGDLSNCATAANGFNSPLGITLAGGYAYIVDQGANTVSACPINSDGSLGICSSQSIGNSPMAIAFLGNHAYVTSANDNTVVACDVDLATGVLSSCSNNSDASFNLPVQIDIH